MNGAPRLYDFPLNFPPVDDTVVVRKRPAMGNSQRRRHNGSRPEPWTAYTPTEVYYINRSYSEKLYPVLHNERKFCRKPESKPFPFMKLPAELRLKIYQNILLQDAPIEFWPHAKDNTTYLANDLRLQTFRNFRNQISPTLGLLRVSSVVHEEASQVFYGANQFRFSGINGWIVLSAWLHTITARHYQHLQYLAVHVPFKGIEYLSFPTFGKLTYHERCCVHNWKQYTNFKDRMSRFGLHVPKQWGYNWCFRDTALRLAKTDLRVFNLVLPPTYYINHLATDFGWQWNTLRTMKTGLDRSHDLADRKPCRFGLVLLRLRERELEAFDAFGWSQPFSGRYKGDCKRMMKAVQEREWIEGVWYGACDGWGAYAVVGREACATLAGEESVEKENRVEEAWLGATDSDDEA